ncbi:endonuclease/exonuclease/phosphatase family protein [Niabella aquatica]
MKFNNLKIITVVTFFISTMILMFLSCNKKPYMPPGPATYIGADDGRYGANNDGQPLLSSLKVMTYNIHACVPPSNPGIADVAAVARAIKTANPDIVFLQEVDKNTGRNGYSGDQAKVIADSLKMNFTYYSAREYLKGFYGIAVLSRYPLSEVRKFLLTKESDATEQRVMGTAYVDLPGKDSVMIAVTHLQHNSATNRLQQVKDIVANLGSRGDRIVLGGDFNELESNTEFFGIFDGAFTRTCKGSSCALTFPAQNPSSVIDFLAYRPASAFSVISHQTVSDTYASDHLPVIAELKINR